MRNIARRRRQSGQTIILLALLGGVLMVSAALVIDIGTMAQARTEEQGASDSAALSGVAGVVNSGSASAGVTQATQVLAAAGFVVGQRGVRSIILEPYNSQSGQFDETKSDRFHVKLVRDLPQHFASAIGFSTTHVVTEATAAVMGAAPVDTNLGAMTGFPDHATLSINGPDADYIDGDPYSSKKLMDGSVNPLYSAAGYPYTVGFPPDLLASKGSKRIRVELFDPDCYNQNGDSSFSTLVDTNHDPAEPEDGGLDMMRKGNNQAPSQSEYPTYATQTLYKLTDAAGTVIASATYGPQSCTAYWLVREKPGTDAIHAGGTGFNFQDNVDLHWITPQGFCFDPTPYVQPIKLNVSTTFGKSVNNYSLRLSSDRASGQAYDATANGITPSGSLGIYGQGRASIQFTTTTVTEMPIGTVPSSASRVIITNFDLDVGSESLSYLINGWDASRGKPYPVLFPAPSSASGSNVVTATTGSKFYKTLPGTMSPNATFATDTLTMPATVPIPQTDSSGHLLLNGAGKMVVLETRAFEGGDLALSYSAGRNDRSTWDITYDADQVVDQSIVLIR